jgi:hypothetical protein
VIARVRFETVTLADVSVTAVCCNNQELPPMVRHFHVVQLIDDTAPGADCEERLRRAGLQGLAALRQTAFRLALRE